MISVEEAKKIIHDNTPIRKPVNNLLETACGLVLASDILAPVDIPAFRQSSMDGYALSFEGWQQHKKLKIIGEIAAGGDASAKLLPQNTVRIFTGAPIPPGADTVVMREKVKTENDSLIIEDAALQTGANIRLQGAETKTGDLALPANSVLSPAAIGFLAMLGLDVVPVFPKPIIHLIVTGKELQKPGNPLQPGQVYEANSFGLSAALKVLGQDEPTVNWADDDLMILKSTLKNALEEADIVILTGGVSAGDYDFVPEAAAQCGVQKLIHKIKQRPGKPFFFGAKENKLVFGLPGNPASVLTCFYEYVTVALTKWMNKNQELQKKQVPIAVDFKKAAGLTHFLKGNYNGETVTPLHAQESFRLSSFATANCLIIIEEDVTLYQARDLVEIHTLP
jgi:molybdopterin molybdotransferase